MQNSTNLTVKNPTGLRTLIKERGLTIDAFAKEVGVSNQRVWKMLSGEFVNVAGDNAVKMALALDTPVADLFAFPDGPELQRLGLI